METEITETEPIITDGAITVTGNDLVYYSQKIALADVTAIRFGWLPIRLDMFRIGGRYVVELKTLDQKIRMNFRSYFGLFRKRQYEKVQHTPGRYLGCNDRATSQQDGC